MLLVIDVGNSHTVLGLYEGDALKGHWRVNTSHYRTADELRVLCTMLLQLEGFSPKQVSGCCISSVVPQLNHDLLKVCRDAFGLDALMVGPGVKTGLVLLCDNPHEVGADRIVNAVGALEVCSGPLVIIDFGTATSLDVVSERSEWCGGVIVPGVEVSANALSERCAKLPKVEIAVPSKVIGTNTVNCIRSGLTYGYASLVDGLVDQIAEEMGCAPTVVATGGFAGTIAPISRRINRVEPDLTLRGLKTIYRKNERVS
jgi:type III pantothenate kinase